jgi:L-threonylcarbamoyladenylate synthase
VGKVIKIDVDLSDLDQLHRSLEEAARVLAAGGVVAYPTETVYGLGADAMNREAVDKLIAIKGRDPGRPLSVLVANNLEAGMLARRITKTAALLMDHFWPGPLTLVVQASKRIDSELLGGGATIGLRLSPHPVSRLLRLFSERPITATSANLSGEPPALSAADVESMLGDRVDLILDAGAAPGGEPSTVVDATGDRAVVLRTGAISLQQLERVVGKVEVYERR